VRVTSAGKYTLLQELEDREAPTYAARYEAGDGGGELVAVERYATDSAAQAEDVALLEEIARAADVLTALYHPNLASVREVVVSAGDVAVVNAFVDGDSYERLLPGGKAFVDCPFSLKLAIVADVVEGLAALHEFARAHDTVLVHGGVTPRNVIVCADGRARLVRVCNLFPEQVSPASPTLGYIAPELLDPSRQPEPSVDVFGAGVMLWEVLVGKRLSVQTNLPSLLLKEFEKGPPRGVPHEELAWAKGLIPLVERALSPAPERYADAEQMARALRAVFAAAPAGARANLAQVGEFVEAAAGDRIRERRGELGFVAPLPVTSSRATIAPLVSRPSLPEVAPLPLPPRVARIELHTMVDEDEYSSRMPFHVSDQDDNLAALAPLADHGDAFVIEAPSADVFWRGGEPTDEKDALRSGVAEIALSGPLSPEARVEGLSSFPPALAPRSPEPLFEDRRKRGPGLWLVVALAAGVALVCGYGLGRGQKSISAPVYAATSKVETDNGEVHAGVAVVAPPSSPELAPAPPELAPAPAPSVPSSQVSRASRRSRPTHGSTRNVESLPAVALPTGPSQTPTTSPTPAPESAPDGAQPSGTEGRQKFNPQGI